MGDAADAVLNGLFDYVTGELIDGREPGWPRRMSDAYAGYSKLRRAAKGH